MRLIRLSPILVALALAGPTAGQTIPAGGSEVFRFALHQKKLEPVTTVEEARANPQSTIIVLVGDTFRALFEIGGLQLRSFVSNGGALLIAADEEPMQFRGVSWANAFEVQLDGRLLRAAPARGYRGSDDRPFVQPLPDFAKVVRRKGPSPYDLFAGVPANGPTAVATDRPSSLRIKRDMNLFTTDRLARYPAGTFRAADGLPVGVDAHFALSFRPLASGGRAVILADQNVFTNGMLGFVKDDARPEGYTLDNGNWEFANRTIDWLQAGSPEPRSKCLFIENGNIVPKFAVELPPGSAPPKMPNIPPELILNWLMTNADPILNEYQDKGVFDKFFQNRPSLLRNAIRFVVIGLTVMFVLIALRRLIRGYRKPDARPLPTAVSEGMLPRGGVARQRTDAQLEIGNLYEAARRRVRDRFDRLGGRPGSDGEMPPVLLANDIRDGELLRSAVAWLWPIGYGDVPVPVPPTEWDRVNALLERLTRRAAAGDWSFGAAV